MIVISRTGKAFTAWMFSQVSEDENVKRFIYLEKDSAMTGVNWKKVDFDMHTTP